MSSNRKSLVAILALAGAASLSTTFTASDANAQHPSLPTRRFFQSTLKGTITGPAVGPALQGFQCSNISVIVQGTHNGKVWARATQATGTYGSCSYSLPVVGGSPFTYWVDAGGGFDCTMVSVLGPNGQLAGNDPGVPIATTKTLDFKPTSINCFTGPA